MVCRLSSGGRWIRTIGPATEKLPLGAPCGFRVRAGTSSSGTDPERDEKFESVLLSGESAKNAAKRLDTGKLPSGSEEDQKF
jgi:hypothetical protein